MARDRKNEMPFELERGSSSVAYVAVFDFSPGEKERGPTYDCAGTPASGPDVSDVEVFFERVERCAAHRGGKPSSTCRACKVVRERRPELDDLVDEDELLEHVAAHADWDDGPDPDDERDRRRDRDLEERGAGAGEAEAG